MKRIILILMMVIFLAFPVLSLAMDVKLQWDSCTDYGLAGYKIYSAITEDGAYDTPITITLAQDENPDPDIVAYTVTGLPDTRTRFVVTAYDTGGNESGYSNEVNTGLTPPTNLLISAIDNIIAGLQDIKAYLAAKD